MNQSLSLPKYNRYWVTLALLTSLFALARANAETTSATLPSNLPEAPCTTATVGTMSRFSINSPFDVDYKSPLGGEGKRLWAKSFLWEKAPKLVVDEWITSRPGLKNKYVMIEIWAGWCSKSRQAIPLLNELQKKFGKSLEIVAISDEPAETIRNFAKRTRMDYAVAADPLGRMKHELGVTAIPHVIVIEPGGSVVWEGFPLLRGFELTEKTMGAILAVGKQRSAPQK